MKEMVKKSEVPGPGSYINERNDQSTIANSSKPSRNIKLNATSSGMGAFQKLEESQRNSSIQKQQN